MTEPIAAPTEAGVSAVTLFVQDLQAAKRFYELAFKRPVVHEDEDAVAFSFGTIVVNLLRSAAVAELIEPATMVAGAGARLVLTIDVDDVDDVCAELQARGIEPLNGPMDRPWGVRTASFQDPDGHVWEIAR